MKNKKLESLMICGLMIGLITIAGCSGTTSSTRGSNDVSSGETSNGDSSSMPTPIYESNGFADRVYALVNHNGDQETFTDYYRSGVSFNTLVDRQITTIATEIVERLNDIYGRDNYKYTNEIDGIGTYSKWDRGHARGHEYQIHTDGSMKYVWVYDDQGNMIPSLDGILADNARSYEAVYYISDTDNNMDSYMGNISCQALATYLLNNNTASDTYTHDSKSTIPMSQMTILAGSIYGNNAYLLAGDTITLYENTSYNAWQWAQYFEDGTAKDRLKYAIADIILNNGYADNISNVDYISYGANYSDMISNIRYLANYVDYYYDAIERFITNNVIGQNALSSDNLAISTLSRVMEEGKDFNATVAYALDVYEYNSAIGTIIDRTNNQISLIDLLNSTNIYSKHTMIGNKTLYDEYEYLVNGVTNNSLKWFADEYEIDTGINKDFFNLYYGIGGSGYIDDAMTIKSYNQLSFPYTTDQQVAIRNIKCYEDNVHSILNAVKDQTFTSGTHGYTNGMANKSIYASEYRVGLDRNITTLSGMASVGSSASYNSSANYNSFIIPASTDITDLSHYTLGVWLGNNREDMSVEIKVQTLDDTTNNNVRVLTPSDKESGADIRTVGTNKYFVPANGRISSDNDWNITFRLPKLTSIYHTGSPYSYDSGSVYNNNTTLTKSSTGVTYANNTISDSLVVTITAYDANGNTIDLDTTYGVSLTLNNTYRVN